MKRFLSGGSSKGEHRKEPKDSGFPMLDGCLMIFEGSIAYDSKRCQKLARREVYTAEPTKPSFL